MNLDINNVIAYLACMFFIFIFGKIFIVPIKTIIKLLIISILGGIIIVIINAICKVWKFHIGLNIITSIFVGFLGLPGAVLIMLIKLILIK